MSSVSAIHFLSQYQHHRAGVVAELEAVEHTVAAGLGQALWDINRDQTRSIMLGLERLPIIEGVRILDSTGAVLGVVGLTRDPDGIVHLTDADGRQTAVRAAPHLFSHTFDLTFDRGDRQFPVGTVTLNSSARVIYDRLRHGLTTLAINALVQIVLFGLVISVVLKRLLTRPLVGLTQAAHNISLETLDRITIDIGARDRDELKVLEEAFNAMVRKLIVSREALHTLNRQLEDHRVKLEHRVAARTEALSAANAHLVQEIHDREQAQRSLALSEANYRTIFDTANDAIFVHQPDTGVIENVNQKMLELYGFASKEDVVGRSPSDLSAPDSSFSHTQAATFLAQAARGQPQLFEWRARNRDGREFWVEVNLKRARIGETDRILAIVRDIDARKQAEQELIESEIRYRALFENEIDAIAIIDPETRRFLDVNQSWLRLYGYSREEVADLTTDSVSAEPENTRDAMHKAVRTGNVYIPKRRHRTKAGRELWVDVSSGPVPVMGRTYLYAILRDITERVEALEALEASEEELQAIFTAMPDIILVLDREGRYLKIAPTSPDLLYRPKDQLLGKTIPETFPPDQATTFMNAIARSLAERTLVTLQYSLTIQDVPVWFDARIAPMANHTVLFVARDITETKRVADEMEAAKEEAEAANIAKSQFLANMSHEIRTPLNAILGLSHLIQQTTLEESQRAYLAKIDSAADTLLWLIDDILDFSKIEAGRLDLEKVEFSLIDVLQAVTATITPLCAKKGLALDLTVAEAVPDRLVGDPMRLEQILMNLAGNAVKFTAKGEVGVAVDLVQRGEGRVLLRFAVRDTGMGISASEQARLFQPFHQADASITRTFGGTGLGLAICKRLVEMLDGEISVDSRPGVGSTFTFSAWLTGPDSPTQTASAPLSKAQAAASLAGLSVLLVEDNEVNRQVSRELLEQIGVRVQVACNGREAVDKVLAKPFDIVLMDVQMPEMDGLSATRDIRRRLPARRLPIIAITANAMAQDRHKCLAAGMSDHIPKPIRPQDLYDVLVRWSRPRKGIERSQAPAAAVGPVVSVGFDGGAGDGTDRPAPGAAWPEIDGLDVRAGLAHVNNDPALFRRVLATARGSLRSAASRIRALRIPEDRQALQDTAHSLKGVAGTLGAHDLHGLAGRLEATLDRDHPAGHGGESPEALVQALDAEMARLLTAIGGFLDAADAGLSAEGSATAEPFAAAPDTQALIDGVQALAALLEEGDAEALPMLDRLRPLLTATLPGDQITVLEECIKGYEFDAAREVCLALLRTLKG